MFSESIQGCSYNVSLIIMLIQLFVTGTPFPILLPSKSWSKIELLFVKCCAAVSLCTCWCLFRNASDN